MTELPKKGKSKSHLWWLLLILAAGFLFRLLEILKGVSFWFDEMFSVHFAQYDLVKMWQLLLYETNPPLHTFFLHFWIKLFGAGEIAVRASSFLLSMLSVVAIYILGKKMFSEKVGLMAAFLMGLSAFQVFYAAEARAYALVQFLTILSLYFFWRLVNERKNSDWFWYFLVTLFLGYSHLFTWFIMIAQNLFVFYFYIKNKSTKNFLMKWLVTQGLMLVIFLVWFIPSFLAKLEPGSLGGWFFRYPFAALTYFTPFLAFLILGNRLVIMELVIVFLSLVFMIYSFVYITREGEIFKIKPDLKAKNVFLLIIIIVSFLPMIMFKLSTPKFYIFLAPPFYLLLSYGFSKLSLSFRAKFLVIVLLIACFVASASGFLSTEKAQWDKVAETIEEREREGDLVINHFFGDALTLRHYYHGNSPIVSFYPLEDEDSDDLRIIKKNWQAVVNGDNVEKLNELTANRQRVFLVYTANLADSSDFVFDWFLRNPWVVADKIDYEGFFSPTIFLYEKIN